MQFKINIKIKTAGLFLFLYSIMPLMDSLNGYILLEAQKNISVGQIYRAVLVFLVIIYLCEKGAHKKYLYATGITVLVLLIFSVLHMMFSDGIGSELSLAFQWGLLWLLFLGLLEMKQSQDIENVHIDKVIDAYTWLIPITIIVPMLLGVGFSTYSGELGYKGFYYANNGVSYAVGVLIIKTVIELFEKFNAKILVKTVLLTATALLLGTKATVLSIIVAIVMSLFLNVRKNGKKGIATDVLIGIVVIILFFAFRGFIMERIEDVLERFNYIDSITDGTFIDALMSGRTFKVQSLWTTMVESKWFPVYFLFGMGNIDLVAEMDILDLFFQFGLLSVLVYLVSFSKLKKYLRYNDRTTKALLIFSLLYSFIVGHVFNNSLSIMIMALLLSRADIVDGGVRK